MNAVSACSLDLAIWFFSFWLILVLRIDDFDEPIRASIGEFIKQKVDQTETGSLTVGRGMDVRASSNRELARRIGVSETAVRRAEKAGRIGARRMARGALQGSGRVGR